MTLEEINGLLTNVKLSPSLFDSIVKQYNDPRRHYHNFTHVERMIKSADSKGWLDDNLILVILYHDIVYEVNSMSNEVESVTLMQSDLEQMWNWHKATCDLHRNNLKYDLCLIYDTILSTKDHIPTSDLSRKLIELDLEVLHYTLLDFARYEDAIFLEYCAFIEPEECDIKAYVEYRVKLMKRFKICNEKIEYIETKYYTLIS